MSGEKRREEKRMEGRKEIGSRGESRPKEDWRKNMKGTGEMGEG